MTEAVLDASAVIALLKGERGASKVAAALANAAVGVFNHAEIISHYVHLGASIDEVRAMLAGLPYELISADEELGWQAGALRATTKSLGLSLGDRFCVALAQRLDVPVLTADRQWKELPAALGIKVVLIR